MARPGAARRCEWVHGADGRGCAAFVLARARARARAPKISALRQALPPSARARGAFSPVRRARARADSQARTLHRSRAFPPPRRRAHRACAAPSSCDVARARARARCLLGARAAAARSKSNGRIDRRAAHATRRHDPAIIPTSSIIQLAKKKKKAKEKGTGAKGGAAAAVDDADALFLLRTENIWRWSVRGFCSAQARGACRSARPAGRGADFAGASSLFSCMGAGCGEEPASHQSARTGRGAPPGSAGEQCCDARCRAPRARQRRRCARRRRQASPLLLASRTRRSASCTAGAERWRRPRWKKGGKEESL